MDGAQALRLPQSEPGRYSSSPPSTPAVDPHPGQSPNALGHLLAWKWELFSCGFALISVFAMVITIKLHTDGSPLPQWPLSITVNGLLSIYGIFLRGCLGFVLSACIAQLQWSWFSEARPLFDAVRYDNASRDAWGAICWLCRHQFRQPLTAIGALLVLASLAVDPIVQQLVVPVNCTWPDTKPVASLPRTNLFYLPYGALSNLSEVALGSIRPALETGVTSSGSDVPVECATGNCVFPESIHTLGFCSSCEDVSE